MNLKTLKSKTIRQAVATLAIGVAIAIPAAASAQAAKPAPAPAASVTTAPAPAPVVVTPEARAAIKELLDVMNTKDNLSKTFVAMSQALAPQMAQAMNLQIENNTSLTPEQRSKIRAGMNEPFNAAVKEAQGIITSPKLVDDTIEKMYGIYASHFSVAEIKQLAQFYKTPLGTKTLTAMPQSINESLQAGVANFQPRIAAVMDKTLKAQIDAATKK